MTTNIMTTNTNTAPSTSTAKITAKVWLLYISNTTQKEALVSILTDAKIVKRTGEVPTHIKNHIRDVGKLHHICGTNI